MTRTLVLAAALAALSSAAFAAPARLEGRVQAPAGQALRGAVVVACAPPLETCRKTRAPVSADGRYVLDLPAAGAYQLLVSQDNDGDGRSSAGDLLAARARPVAAPGRAPTLNLFVVSAELVAQGSVPAAATVAAAAPATGVAAGSLAGRWTQRSSTQELVLVPTIKFQPSISTSGFGTNLGGTFGAGSATNTTIVNEFKPLKVDRAMTLEIAADGGFRWTIDKTQPKGSTCTATVRQEKTGRVRQQGGRLVFAITGGTQTSRDSCGGQSSASAVPAATEDYALAREGGKLRLTGTGGVDWTFSR